jgi:nucleoside-diphosphate-sugar epimerase
MSITGKRIALIGGAGFIGHHLALELTRRGARVDVVDSLQVNNLLMLATSNLDNYSRKLYTGMVNQRLDLMREAGVELHPQDARDYHALSRILSRVKPDVIVQLAAVSHANRSNKDPFSTFDHSLRTLENALDIARDNCNHFVFFSSSMVYGNFQKDSVDEEDPLNPIGIYGALKLAGEKIVIAYNQVFALPFTIVRPSALYGPRCISRRVGQVFIENALRGEKLRVDGDGNDRLDFTYIDDLVQGICLVIGSKESRNQIFNLTYGASRSIQDLLEVIKGYFPKVTIESVPKDRLMPERGTLKVDKARDLLGYAPQNPVEVAFPKYVEWYLSNSRQPAALRGDL